MHISKKQVITNLRYGELKAEQILMLAVKVDILTEKYTQNLEVLFISLLEERVAMLLIIVSKAAITAGEELAAKKLLLEVVHLLY